MDRPNMDDLSLSDSDTDALFDTPAARKNKSKTQDETADAAEDGAAASKARGKESHYTTEEAREAALRKELENVRNVNKVIKGVVESLEKAKNNMDVCGTLSHGGACPFAHVLIRHRLYPAQYTMHPPCCRRGHAFSLKQNTTSA